MKKILAFTLMSVMVLSMTACGSKETAPAEEATTEEATTEAAAEETATEVFAQMHKGSEWDMKILMLAQFALLVRRGLKAQD